MLAQLGVTADAVRSGLAPGDAEPAGSIPFTPQAKEALELALREAMSLRHTFIGTEHLLLGLARVEGNVAGYDYGRIHAEVLRMIGGMISPRAFPQPQFSRDEHGRRRRHSPLTLIVAGWLMGAVTLGAGIGIGYFIWG